MLSPLCSFLSGKHEICVVGAGNAPRCACKKGYMKHDTFGCVDEKPPVLKLKHDPNGDQTLRLKQGDSYHEYAVEVQDANAEEYMRTLQIAYSRPLPDGCLTEIGEFHVNYTISTPWTTPPYVRATRRVIIEDIDECKLDVSLYDKKCPILVPHCAAEAKCKNVVGSYTCQCPQYMSGDGFRVGGWEGVSTTPKGFQGGTGCRDNHAPVITLNGPQPKVFKVCICGGISGIMHSRKAMNQDLRHAQRQLYDADIKVR